MSPLAQRLRRAQPGQGGPDDHDVPQHQRGTVTLMGPDRAGSGGVLEVAQVGGLG